MSEKANKQTHQQTEETSGLEIEEDPLFQRRSWQVERTAWLTMAALIVAALSGLFGDGPLSRAETPESMDATGKLRVRYERFARLNAPLRVQMRVLAPRAGELRVWVSRAYLDHMQVESISPPPERVAVSADQLIYFFRVTDTDAPLDIDFHLTAEQVGQLRGQAGTESSAPVSFQSFIFP